MTREEIKIAALRDREIKIAASNYVEENSVNGYEAISSHIDSFIEGANWADENPKNIWHDASEEPRMNHKNIIYQTNYCSLFNVYIAFVPTCLRSSKITSYSWNEFVKDVNMRRWAYISDLLPKQFRNTEQPKGGEK